MKQVKNDVEIALCNIAFLLKTKWIPVVVLIFISIQTEILLPVCS